MEYIKQTKYAYLETSEEFIIFFRVDKCGSFGLPILLELFHKNSTNLNKKSRYSYTFCNHSQYIESAKELCQRCQEEAWVESINTIRIA